MLAAVPPEDPSWLLSSLAQSAAALVAILGGFLVTRLVTASIDRGRLTQRNISLEEEAKLRREALVPVHRARLAFATERFIDHHKQDVADAHGNADPGLLANRWRPIGSSVEEMTEVGAELVEQTKRAFSAFAAGGWELTYADEMRRHGVDVAPEAEEAFEAAARTLRREHPRPPSIYGLAIPDFPPVVIPSEAATERQHERVETIRSETAAIGLLDQERARAHADLAGLVVHLRLGLMFGTLGYLALSGIVLPLVIMALRPVPDGWPARWGPVGAFAAGLVLLAVVFWRTVKDLQADSS